MGKTRRTRKTRKTRKTRRATMRSKRRLSKKKKKSKSHGPMVACACACACARARARVRMPAYQGTLLFSSLVLRPGMFYRNQHTILFFFFGLQAGDFLSQAPHMLQARTGRYDQRPTEN